MTPRAVTPVTGPLRARVTVPGSKSESNRVLLAAALADGSSTVAGLLRADDTEAMLGALAGLGVGVDDQGATEVIVHGCGGTWPVSGDVSVPVWTNQSGTASRFLLAALAAAGGDYVLDGDAQLRARPFRPLTEALRALGATIDGDRLPVHVASPRLTGGVAEIAGDASSQFLSGLLLAGPLTIQGLAVRLTSELVSTPYVDLTIDVMRRFGAQAGWDGPDRLVVSPGGYRASDVAIEADASAASYFFAAAAIVGGSVTVDGLGRDSLQGDLGFVDLLERMGCVVHRTDTAVTVSRTGPLRGIDADLSQLSDTVPSLAVVAPFADSPTRIRGVGFIRAKESDRIGLVVRELAGAGIAADEHRDGFTVHPGAPHAAVLHTHGDHRLAMAFALLGLVTPGVEIDDPDCVAKTFPGFWDVLHEL